MWIDVAKNLAACFAACFILYFCGDILGLIAPRWNSLCMFFAGMAYLSFVRFAASRWRIPF